MEQLYRLAELALELFIVLFGLALVLHGAGIIKQSPGRILGTMARATLRGVWWLVKGTLWLIGIFIREAVALIQAIARGAPADKQSRAQGASFLTGFERWKLMNRWRKGGLVVDGKRRLSLQRSYRNAAVLSPTGGGKTSVHAMGNLLQLSGHTSCVVTDPSGELYAKTSGWLYRQGFNVKIFNVSDVRSLRFNPLFRVRDYTDAGIVSQVLIDHAYPDHRGEQFWNASARSLLTTLIRCLKNESLEYQNLHNLRFCLNNFGQDGSPLNAWISKCTDEAMYLEWRGFVSQSPKVMQSIISTARTALEKVSDLSIAALTATESVHFEELRERPTVLYIVVPEHQTKYFGFLTSLLYSQIFNFCMQPKQPGEAYLPIFFILDEFAHCRLPDFSTTISTIRKYDCSLSILVQDWSQIEHVYGKLDASTILSGGTVTKIYMAGLSQETCERLSRLIGRGEDRRPLLTPDQVRTLPDNRAILVHGNRRPVMMTLTPYFKSRKLLKRTRIPPAPLPESKTSAELHYVYLYEEQEDDSHSLNEAAHGEATTPVPSPTGTPDTREVRKETAPSVEATIPPEKDPVTSERPLTTPSPSPSWAHDISQELRRTQLGVEMLRDAVQLHVISRKEAATLLGVSTKTLRRWEQKSILARVPGSSKTVHYTMDSILKLKQERS